MIYCHLSSELSQPPLSCGWLIKKPQVLLKCCSKEISSNNEMFLSEYLGLKMCVRFPLGMLMEYYPTVTTELWHILHIKLHCCVLLLIQVQPEQEDPDSPVCPWSAPGSPPRWTCLKHLPRGCSLHPGGILSRCLNQQEQQLYFEPILDMWAQSRPSQEGFKIVIPVLEKGNSHTCLPLQR